MDSRPPLGFVFGQPVGEWVGCAIEISNPLSPAVQPSIRRCRSLAPRRFLFFTQRMAAARRGNAAERDVKSRTEPRRKGPETNAVLGLMWGRSAHSEGPRS